MRKILRSLPESFRAKVTAIKESKDLDEIKIKNSLDLSKPMSSDCLLTSLANHLLSKI